MHTDMLDHTSVYKLAVDIHILAEIEVDIHLEHIHQMADIDQRLEKVEDKDHILDTVVLAS
jgi:hypothetical protein